MVLRHVKRWVLAMLARKETGCAWLCSRRVKDAALLTRPARHDRRKASGRRASPDISTRLRRGSNKGRLLLR